MNESDPTITHQIIDRPALSNEALDSREAGAENGSTTDPRAGWPYSTVPGRTYVQPQWVWDCINQSKLLRPDLYAPGAELPPHLSPWVKPKQGEYDPSLPLEVQQPEGETEAFDDESDNDDSFDTDQDEVMDDMVDENESIEARGAMDIADPNSDSDSDDSQSGSGASEPEFEGFDSDAETDISETEAARFQHQRELEAEATGAELQVTQPSKGEEESSNSEEIREEEALRR